MYEQLASILSNPWVTWTFTALYSVTVVAIMGVILSENRNPVKSLAWVMVLTLLPVLGIVIYLFFGRNLKNTRMISRRDRRRLRKAEKHRPVDLSAQGLSEPTMQMAILARSLNNALYYAGNDITIFTDGSAKFAALERDLRAAEQYINLQYYIFDDGRVGRRIRDILIEKARAGVTVRVIYDHVGSINTPNSFFREMSDAGVQVYPFFRVTFKFLSSRLNWRNHRKLVVIDGKTGYIGGMNIADRYVDGGKRFREWHDSHLRITGSAVASLQYSFAVDWNFMGRPLIQEPVQVPAVPAGTIGAQLITSGPTSRWSNVEFMFHKAIAGALKRIYIQTPYFLPTDGLLKALQAASLAHVDVRIMIPRESDSKLLKYASFSYIQECLQAGIKIYLYDPGMLHSKNIIIDEELTSVGSTNFDFRSFEHNFEANLFIYSRDFNERMTDHFFMDLRRSTRVLASQWAKRPRSHRFLESVTRLLAPVL